MHVVKNSVNRLVAGLGVAVTALVAIGYLLVPMQATARISDASEAFEASDIPYVAATQVAPEEGQAASQGDAVQDQVVDEGFERVHEEPAQQYAPCETLGAYTDADSSAQVRPASAGAVYSSDQLRTQGVIYDGGYRYTWYSQRVLPGGGLAIEGRHVSDEGYVVDSAERIVVASSDIPRGTEIDVPFGSGKAVVLDTGCAPGTLDVYTDF